MDTTDLMRELRELRQRIDDFEPPKSSAGESLPQVVIIKDPAQQEGNLKPTSFPVYNGEKMMYPAWRRGVLSALRIDWNTYKYTDSRVFLMIYKSLEGKAQKQAASYFESGGVGGRERPEDFIAFLDRGNWDQTRTSRAKSELNEMRMGPKQKWGSFYNQWANKLTEASGDTWPDDVKVSLLRTALNQSLRIALASNHLIPENNFAEYVRVVSKIAQQHEEISRTVSSFHGLVRGRSEINKERTLWENSDRSFDCEEKNKEWGRSGTEKGPVGEMDRVGDIYMGGINSTQVLRGPTGKPLRAKWKSPDQIRRLKEDGRCYRCERKGCSTRVCKILPALNPNRRSALNVASVEPLNLDLFEEDEDIDVGQVKVSEN